MTVLLRRSSLLLICLLIVGGLTAQQANGPAMTVQAKEGRRLAGQSRLQLDMNVPYPTPDSSITANAFIYLEDPISGIEFQRTQQLLRLHPDSSSIKVSWALPWAGIILPEASPNIRVRIRLNAPDFPGGFSEHRAKLQVNLPEIVWLEVQFGDFVVSERTAKGRKWDRPFLFGNGVPEFFWKLEYGYESAFASGYQKGNQFTGRPTAHVRIVKGDTLELSVLEEDDVKRDFAGSIALVPSMMNYDSYCEGDSLSFGQVLRSALCARDDKSPFPGAGFMEPPRITEAFFQHDSAEIRLRSERLYEQFGAYSYLQRIQVFQGETEIPWLAIHSEISGKEAIELESGWYKPEKGEELARLRFPAEFAADTLSILITEAVQRENRPVELFRKSLKVKVEESRTYFPRWLQILGISLAVVAGLLLLSRLPFVKKWLNTEPGA